MTRYEIISSLIAIIALVISTISLARTRKVHAKQLEFEAISAALAKKQLESIDKEEQAQKTAQVTAELVKVGKANYRFVIMNQSAAVASDVTFDISSTSSDNPLVENDCRRKLPYPSLQPGQSFMLIAALHTGSAMSYSAQLNWKNPDGSLASNDVHLST